MKRADKMILWIGVALMACGGCAGQRKVRALKLQGVQAKVSVSEERAGKKDLFGEFAGAVVEDTLQSVSPDTASLEVRDIRGNRIIMNAVLDEGSGEMVATDVLQEIVVEADFRNVAERKGEVEVAFAITVPPQMQDPQWQIRFQPGFYIHGDTLYSDQVHITGKKYREEQLKGYELYRKFLNTIIPDSCNFEKVFCYQRLMEIFIARKFKTNPEWANDTVVRQEVVDYYTRHRKLWLNNQRKERREEMFRKYVKSPFMTEGVRLDSVITTSEGALKYHYAQSIKTRKGLRKIEMVLSGEIYAIGKRIYQMPATAPLSFYVSSVSAFTDPAVRYLKTIVERNVTANTAAYIDFKAGQWQLEDTLHNNREELARIRGNIRQILSEPDFEVDSLVITASCSPEGAYASNRILAHRRAEGIRDYFQSFVTQYRDSVKNAVWEIDLTGSGTFSGHLPSPDTWIKVRSIPEEWGRLEQLIRADTSLTDREALLKCFEIPDLDTREAMFRGSRDYSYLRSRIYPYLRTVKFDFFLHRKGMLKDTVHTTQVDTAYMAGLRALQERDYQQALVRLRPYADFNTAVAYVSLDYNQSALSILNRLPKSARRDYMLALVHARLGDERLAVELYLHACEEDASMRFRGSLDPEISALIKKYGMNKE